MFLTRRDLLRQASALSAGAAARPLCALSVGAAPDPTSARLTLFPDRVGPAISPTFIGLGYEVSSVTRPGLFQAEGEYVRLVRALSPRGVIRIGGNTADFARFEPHGAPVSTPKGTVVTQADLDRLRRFLDATGWQLIWGLNLGSGTGTTQVQQAVEEAVAVSTTMGDRLLAVEVGNEPDLFWIEHRPKPYTYEQFRSEFVRFRDAILQRLPNLPLAGPDVAGATSWVRRFATDEPENLRLLTHHYYREGQNPTSSAAKLLGNDPKLLPQLQELQSVSRATGLPYRICEVNSFSGGGRPGVSDTFASALWVLDYMLLLATYGCSGVNLETGVNQLGFVSSYSPMYETGSVGLIARPELYGMLAFCQATQATQANAARSHVVDCELEAGGLNVTAYAIRRADSHAVVLINKEADTDVTIAFRVARSGPVPEISSYTLCTLTADGLGATSGVKLCGKDPFAVPKRGERIWIMDGAVPTLRGGAGPIRVQAGSATLISLSF